MKILVDNGTRDNIGDLSMLEGATILLADQWPAIQIYVVCKSSLPNKMSNIDNVRFIDWVDLTWIRRVNCIKREGKQKQFAKMVVYTAYVIKLVLGGNPLKSMVETKEGSFSLGKYCSEFSGFILCGGGYLNDVFIHELITKMFFMKAFALLNRPFMLSGQQIGPFKYGLLRKLLKQVLVKAKFIGLREASTSPLLLKNDSRLSGLYKVCGDDSFGVEQENDLLFPNEVSELLEKYGCFVAVNFRYSGYAIANPEYFDKFGRILLRLQTTQGYPYVLIPIALNPGDSDIVAGDILKNRFPELNLYILRDRNVLGASYVKMILQKAFGSIGVSYHFCTFSLSMGTPAICLYDGKYYEQKAKGLCSFWENDCWAASIRLGSEDLIASQVSDTFNDDLIREKLHELAKVKKLEWRKHLTRIFREVFKNAERR